VDIQTDAAEQRRVDFIAERLGRAPDTPSLRTLTVALSA
jgi:hypothetical protein